MKPFLTAPFRASFAGCVVASLLAACASPPVVTNPAGQPTIYLDTTSPGIVRGTGIESQDIQGMVDKMVRHMLANPLLANATQPPRVIVDSAFFENQSSQRINKNILTDHLATQLQIAANGRILFIDRENAAMVAAERALKNTQATDSGATGRKTQAGADYRLSGRITSLDTRTGSGIVERYMNVVFRMTDLESTLVVWSNQYNFKKVGQDDIIYR